MGGAPVALPCRCGVRGCRHGACVCAVKARVLSLRAWCLDGFAGQSGTRTAATTREGTQRHGGAGRVQTAAFELPCRGSSQRPPPPDQVALSKPSGLQVLPAAMFHQRTVLSLLRRVYGGGDSGAGGGGSGEAARAGPGAAAGAEAGADVGRGAVVAGGPAGVAGDAACACSCSSEAKAQGGGAQQAKKERQARQQRQRQYLDVPAPVHRLGRGTSGWCDYVRPTKGSEFKQCPGTPQRNPHRQTAVNSGCMYGAHEGGRSCCGARPLSRVPAPRRPASVRTHHGGAAAAHGTHDQQDRGGGRGGGGHITRVQLGVEKPNYFTRSHVISFGLRSRGRQHRSG